MSSFFSVILLGLFPEYEYPCEDFYPMRVMERLLEHIPLVEWSAMRKGWAASFDKMTTRVSKRLTFLVNGNHIVGNITKCTSDGKFRIRTGTSEKIYTLGEFSRIWDRGK